MSTLLADTIRKTGGSLGTDIRIKNTSVYESDGGTSVTQNIVQGLAKCWASHPHDDVVDDSFNLGSLTDSGTGRYICNFTNNMGNTKYIVPNCGAAYGDSTTSNQVRGGDFCGLNMVGGSTDSRATDHCDVACIVGSNGSADGSASDRDWTMHIFFGDLA